MTDDVPTELLAPAGCYASLQAAIDNGADAVYFGLAQLNMRARARRSFHLEDLPEIVRICKEANVKSCLTMNTLLYEHDLKLARSILERAKEVGCDAVIASDMAAIQIANEIDLEVHISTQLSLSNYDAVKFYAQFCDRVVLARELNLSMIRSIWEKMQADDLRGVAGRPMEIEAFAHGALCIAVSGRCGMSLYNSNASANRGACEQNCRKEYIVKDVDTGKEMLVDNNTVMSPNDILTIDFIDEMIHAGVRVFKIEGRGRAPEYVGAVIKAYRAAIDAVENGTFTKEFAKSLIPSLEKVYNRGFSSGYYLGRQQGWSGSGNSKATHRKVLVGKITNHYQKAGVIEVARAAADFSVGDDYVIIGDETGAVRGDVPSLRYEAEGGEMIDCTTVKRGSTFTMPHDGKVKRGDMIYKMAPVAPLQNKVGVPSL
ncbi:peptidase U32 family protein [Sulfuriroseicoccus oceanibius]|uniref:U32 family peptidase n=1 Tax=Sulfuriroseicoccus oceanibius TaxID=2707525 RepID=A0A6B3L692_9BACT|nr:peptidase U32 family protein [Sulfuriroseicoccus oceanibius]QQL46119.1 U32 family peptidase [Sulfuriroseicoccus oceanibius]